MDLAELWLQFRKIFIDIVKYGFPTVAIVLSIFSYFDSRKANKVQERLIKVEEKLKNYELEEKEKEREEALKACIEARIVKISQKNYRMKIWNSGKAIAYNVDFNIGQEYKLMVLRNKVPFEFLEPNKSFEENVYVHGGTSKKINMKTIWKDKEGVSYSNEQIVTI